MSQKTTDIQIQIKIRGWTVSDIIQIYIRYTHTLVQENQPKELDQLIQVVHTWTLLVLMERKDDM